jgi:archaellum component FlaC
MTDADYTEWSTDRLERRLRDLKDSANVNHSAERMTEISRSIGRLTFELDIRKTASQTSDN